MEKVGVVFRRHCVAKKENRIRKIVNAIVAVAVLAGTSIVARPAEAGCAKYMIANVDTCANPPCPVVICRLIGEGGGYCMYTC